MNVLIIEDEIIAYKSLKKMLLKYDASIHITNWFKSVNKAVAWLAENEAPDVIFLDIKLTDGLSFEIFDRIEITAPIIFTTAYHEYAIKAFEVNSVAYLLKPFSQESLEKSLEKLKKYRIENSSDLIKNIKEAIAKKDATKSNFKDRFLVKLGDKLFTIPVNEIAYFYRDDLVMLATKNNKKYVINYSLDELEHMLNSKTFFRINRQFVVNIESIVMVHNYFGGKLKVDLIPKPQSSVTISQEKASIFKDWMDGN